MKYQRRQAAKCAGNRVLYWNLASQAFKFVSRQGLEWLECVRLLRLPWLLHAFSTRRGGVSNPPAAELNLGFVEGDRRANVEENRRRFLQQLGADGFSLAMLRQVHSARIYQVVEGLSGRVEYRPSGFALPKLLENRLAAGDGLLTNQAGILLSIRTADCLPILLVELQHHAIAAVHVGWRGALAHMVEKAVGEMRRVFGSRPADLLAALGPSIRSCCYEVGEEVVAAFCARFANGEKFFRKAPSTTPPTTAGSDPLLLSSTLRPEKHAAPATFLDLGAVARAQLCCAGVRPANISVAEFCTACRTDLFFSHRKERGRTGRTMAIIGIRP